MTQTEAKKIKMNKSRVSPASIRNLIAEASEDPVLLEQIKKKQKKPNSLIVSNRRVVKDW
jgi:hypothetical protein